MTQSKTESSNRSRNSDGSFYRSKLYHDWYSRVASGEPNDYVICITAHPGWTGVSGTGKTTLGGALAKWYLDFSDEGFDATTHYTLDPSALAYDLYEQTGPGATLIYDEAQGTPATTGLNSKRAMKTESIDALNTIATRRRDRKTVIIISQSLKSVISDLYDYIDAWLLIVDDVNYVASHYAVVPEVFNLEAKKTTTPGIEQLSWDPLPPNDPDYGEMDRQKTEAIQGKRSYSEDAEDGEEEQTTLPKPVRDEKIRKMASIGIRQKDIAETFGLTQQAVSNIVNDL